VSGNTSTLCLKKRQHFIFWITPSKTIRFLKWFLVYEIWYQKVIKLPTSPVYCGYTILRSAKVIFQQMLFIHASEYLGYHWIKWMTNVTVQLSMSLYYSKYLKWLPLQEHNYRVCYATVCSTDPRCSAGIQSMSQSAAATTRLHRGKGGMVYLQCKKLCDPCWALRKWSNSLEALYKWHTCTFTFYIPEWCTAQRLLYHATEGNLQDLSQHCCLATCQDWQTNLTAIFGRTCE